jgi:hypothetical protein
LTQTDCLDTLDDDRIGGGGGTVDPKSGGRKPRWPIVVGIVVAAAFLGLMIALHLSGSLGPGMH